MRFYKNIMMVLLLSQTVTTVAYADQPALTPLDAKFETIECAIPCKKPVKSMWWMWRTPNQVELRTANSSNSELWQLLPNGQLGYQFLMHDEKRAIEYATTDLNMLDMPTDMAKWQSLTHLVTQQDLAGMKKSKLKKQYLGMDLTQYSGKINGIQSSITWLDALQIPLKMAFVYPKRQVTIQLLEQDKGKWPLGATTAVALRDYQQVDYADIGDMEHSSIANKWLAKAGGAPGLNAHGTHDGHGH